MPKTISIIRGSRGEDYESFFRRAIQLAEDLRSLRPSRLHYTITLQKPPRLSVIPFRRDKIALFSVTSGETGMHHILQGAEGYSGSFLVNGALPLVREMFWESGEASPGLCLLTLFRQKRGITREDFIHRWHQGHTPFTLKVHPICHYDRNEVVGALDEVPQWYDGIVEEHCHTGRELLNPFRFFSKNGLAPVNMIKTYFDVKSFIDYKSIETYLVREFVVVNKPPAAVRPDESIEPTEAL
jgi:hypothetical protein